MAPRIVQQGELFRHNSSNILVTVRSVTDTGSIVWESLDEKETIEGYYWGKMSAVEFGRSFRQVRSQEAETLLRHHDGGTKEEGQKAN